jgi:hypothetical protein
LCKGVGKIPRLECKISKPWPLPTRILPVPVYSSAFKLRLERSLVRWTLEPVSRYQEESEAKETDARLACSGEASV